MKKTRSARGTMVDFDLIKIKETLGSEPAPTDVAARQNHIDARLRRRMRNMKKPTLSTAPVAPKADVAAQPKETTKSSTTKVEPKSTAVNETEVDFIDDVQPDETDRAKPKTTQQKARRKT